MNFMKKNKNTFFERKKRVFSRDIFFKKNFSKRAKKNYFLCKKEKIKQTAQKRGANFTKFFWNSQKIFFSRKISKVHFWKNVKNKNFFLKKIFFFEKTQKCKKRFSRLWEQLELQKWFDRKYFWLAGAWNAPFRKKKIYFQKNIFQKKCESRKKKWKKIFARTFFSQKNFLQF